MSSEGPAQGRTFDNGADAGPQPGTGGATRADRIRRARREPSAPRPSPPARPPRPPRGSLPPQAPDPAQAHHPPAPATRPARQVAVLAAGTWRLAWRAPLTRRLLALTLLLAVAASIAAIGSPSPGDGAIRVLALCLQVVPFAIVPLAGDVWRSDSGEAALASRPLDAASYVIGRATGLLLVGLTLLAAAGAAAVAGLWLIARLPLLPDVAWIGVLAAVYVAPGFLLLIGACSLWLAAGRASRHPAAAVVTALLVALYSYELGAIASSPALQPLAFFSPFPGLLTLGLAVPPALLGAPWIPAWIVWNRAFFAAAGLVLLALAARRRSRGRDVRLFPLRSLPAWRVWLAAALVAALGAGAPLAAAAPSLAPQVLPAMPTLRGVLVPPVTSLDLSVTADAATGQVRGDAAWGLAAAGGPLYVLLNAGLALTAPAGVRVTLPDGEAMVPGTAARLYRLDGGAASRGGDLRLTFAGRLLPRPSTVPVPPFAPGQAFEGAAVGGGRAFFDGRGTWYPVPVGSGLAPGDPAQIAMTLTLTHTGGARWIGLPAESKPGGTIAVEWRGGPMPAVVGALAPYHAFPGLGYTYAGLHAPAPDAARALATYAAAAATLRPQLAAALPGPVLRVAADPLLAAPVLADGVLWAPGDQSACVPPDPVAGTCGGGAPTPRNATLLLSSLAWQAALYVPADGLALPRPASEAASAWLVAPRAAVVAWKALNRSPAISVAWTGSADLPWIGPLSAMQRDVARQAAGQP